MTFPSRAYAAFVRLKTLVRVGLGLEGALSDYGWHRTYWRHHALDREQRPIPWFSYPAIEFLSRRITPDLRVFEYGSGAGTLWWAERVKEVVSCEHDENWCEGLRPRLPPNARLEYRPLAGDPPYARAVLEAGSLFDLVVIDGRERVECARQAVSALSPAGVIVWDDTERSRYQEGLRTLRDAGFRTLELAGPGPIELEVKETTILYRPGNVLGI